MRGRTENKIAIERALQAKIAPYPRVIKSYYYSLNTAQHTTKMRYINNVLRFIDYRFSSTDFSVGELAEITKLDIDEYINSISFFDVGSETRELKASTKACIYSSLSNFFSFLVNDGYIEVNPMDRIKRPKVTTNDVVFLEPGEVITIEDKILTEGVGNKTARSKQQNWKYRDFLLFHIPVINGIRVEALREIDITDIHLNRMCITVTEKGNITKDVYLDDTAIRYIRLWLRERENIMGKKDDGALFISNRRTRMSVRSIENIIVKYADGINGKHITCHKLRSTFGTNAYGETRDIKAVAQALGHKTTVPTERYVKSYESRNKETVGIVANLYKKH